MIAYMRNVQTGEIREVERDSDEQRELAAEVYDHNGSARPAWEQTGDHHVRRMDSGNVHVPADLGYEDKPAGSLTAADAELLQADPHPERSLTAAERNAGLDSFEQKQKELGIAPSEDDAERVDRGLERVGREGGGSSRSRSGGNGETVAQLKERAKADGIEGYSSMNKGELQEALGSNGGEEGDE